MLAKTIKAIKENIRKRFIVLFSFLALHCLNLVRCFCPIEIFSPFLFGFEDITSFLRDVLTGNNLEILAHKNVKYDLLQSLGRENTGEMASTEQGFIQSALGFNQVSSKLNARDLDEVNPADYPCFLQDLSFPHA